MKRAIAMTLALLMLAGCAPACAYTYLWEPETAKWGEERLPGGVQEALQAADRFFAGVDACVRDHTGEIALTVVEHDDETQLTILRKNGEGAWQVEASNDTLPFQRFNRKEARWWVEGTEETPISYDEENDGYDLDADVAYDGWFRLEMEVVHEGRSGYDRMPGDMLLVTIHQDEAGWYVASLGVILFQAEDGSWLENAPYYTISQNRITMGEWSYRYFEWNHVSKTYWERTEEPLYTAAMTDQEVMARMRLDDFDFPALIAYLEGLLPDDLPDARTVPGAVSGREEDDGKQAAAMQETSGVMVYYNAEGGMYYHAAATCSAVAEQCWPLAGIPIEQLNTPNFSRLLPCPKCDPPERLPVPEAQKTPEFVYYNPNGGRYYHAVDDCPSVSPRYLPMTAISFDDINDAEYARLYRCPFCNAPERPWFKNTDEN